MSAREKSSDREREREKLVEQEMTEEKSRTIKLFCPPLSKVVGYVAREEQRLDLGSIARTFGLDPLTLKLNGHFISRGVDLISSSVTWKSLLSFFSARGLSTGADDSDALIVSGKLSKPSSKRTNDLVDFGSRMLSTDIKDAFIATKPQLEEHNFIKIKKLKENNRGCENEVYQRKECNDFGLKRKQWSDYVNPIKRIRVQETLAGFLAREGNLPGGMSKAQFSCSCSSETAKRRREEELSLTSPCKRSR